MRFVEADQKSMYLTNLIKKKSQLWRTEGGGVCLESFEAPSL